MNEIVAPKNEEIESVRQMIGFFIAKNVDVFVNVNNHYEGSAPLTIRKIQEAIKALNIDHFEFITF